MLKYHYSFRQKSRESSERYYIEKIYRECRERKIREDRNEKWKNMRVIIIENEIFIRVTFSMHKT